MPLTLAVNKTGSGQFTFTVTTAAGGIVRGSRLHGSRNRFDLDWSALWTFTNVGGTSPATTLLPGVWVITATNSAGEISGLEHLHVADPAEALAIHCRTLVANTVRASGVDILSSKVYEMQEPVDLLKSYPAVYVNLRGTTEQDTGDGTETNTHWIYPVKLLIAARVEGRLNDKDCRLLMSWRQIYLEGFDWMCPASDAAIEYTRSQPGPQFAQYVFQGPNEHLVTCTEITVNCHCHRPRGFPH